LLLVVSLEIVTQAIVEGQLAGYLPAVLGENADAVLTQLHIRGRGDLETVNLTQEEAGVIKSTVATQTRGNIFPGIARLIGRHAELAVALVLGVDDYTIVHQLPSKLERVVALHPCQIGV